MASIERRKRHARVASVVKSDAEVEEALDAISGSKQLGQQREPKWIHPFPARLPIVIADHLINSLTSDGAIVVDPMVGSGTTLIAACRLGREVIGIDRDHLAVRLARCAAHSFDVSELNRLRDLVLSSAKSALDSGSLSLPSVRGQLPKEDQDFIRFWFPTKSQRQLFALASAIEECAEGALADLAWVVFSSLIIAKSAGASFAMDISRSRPHKRDDKPVVAPFDAWNKKFAAAVARLPFVDEPISSTVTVEHGDARSLPLEDCSADFVLTSPPYRNAIDYLRGHKFSLVWMGYPLSEIRELRGTMIGTERGLWSLDGLPQTLEDRLLRADAAPRQVALMRRYLSDMKVFLSEVHRILRPEGLAVVVVGPTMINARRTDAADVLTALAKDTGLKVVASRARSLDSSRRSLPFPVGKKNGSELGKRMSREIVVALRKR